MCQVLFLWGIFKIIEPSAVSKLKFKIGIIFIFGEPLYQLMVLLEKSLLKLSR
jgi:hypothetical protein